MVVKQSKIIQSTTYTSYHFLKTTQDCTFKWELFQS
jgi:hypothetical protein